MDEQKKADEAKTHTKRAATQAKHASKNTGKAAKAAVEAAAAKAEKGAEKGLHVVDEAAHKTADITTAGIHKGVDVTEDAARKVGPVVAHEAQVGAKGLMRIPEIAFRAVTSDVGQGSVALTVSVLAGVFAARKFHGAITPKAPIVVLAEAA